MRTEISRPRSAVRSWGECSVLWVVLILLSAFILPQSSFATNVTYYVDANIGRDYADGLSTTVTNIQGPKRDTYSAIATAQNGDTINVAAGTYEEPPWDPTTKSLTLNPADGVIILPLTPAQLAATSTNTWAHGLTRLQVFQNPSVLIADNYSRMGDGIPDWWKVKYGFGLTDPTVATADPDHDGFTNLQEYKLSTDPTDPGSQPTNFPDNLVGWWMFDEGTGSNALDSSFNGFTGSLTGSPWPQWTNGISSSALLFNGTNTVQVLDAPLLTPTNQLTVLAWVQQSSSNTTGLVFSKWAADGLLGSYRLGFSNSQLVLELSVSGVVNSATGATSVIDGYWHQVGGVYDGMQMVVYLDGNVDGILAVTGAVDVVTAPLLIGQLAGTINDVHLFSRALSSSELANYSTLNDGIPDWWKVAYGFSITDSTVAGADMSGDGINNLTAYQYGVDPYMPDLDYLVLNGGQLITSNTVITVDASASPFPLLLVSLFGNMADPVILSNTVAAFTLSSPADTTANYTFYFQFATANTNTLGITVSETVTIDTKPPVIELDPGNGQSVDLSDPLLRIAYLDPSGADTNVAPAGLDLSSLVIILDGVNVTANFYIFASGAVADGSNLAVGTHTWTATIADLARNVASNSVTFTATGAANPNAPTLAVSSLSAGSVTVLPDMPQLWVQGNVGGVGSVVSASVNGGTPITMNQRGGIYGYMLPLDPGTNCIVLTACDGTTNNCSSQLLVVERSTKYQASLSWTDGWTGFGRFANGSTQEVSGVVSRIYDDGSPNGLSLASVTILAGDQTISIPMTSLQDQRDGTYSFDPPIAPPDCDTSVMPIIVWLCWTGTSFSAEYTNICQGIPLGLLEGYEIVSKQQTSVFAGSPIIYGVCSNGQYNWDLGGKMTVSNSFELACTATTNSYWQEQDYYKLGCQATADLDTGEWDCFATNTVTGVVLQPSRDLTFDASTYFADTTWTNNSESGGWYNKFKNTSDGSLTFRAPFYYPSSTPVVLTFEGVNVNTTYNTTELPAPAADLTQVQYNSAYPIATDPNQGLVSYFITVDGGKEYTINQDSFTWLPYDANQTFPLTDPYVQRAVTIHVKTLSFTGFHNGRLIITPANPPCELGGTITLTAALIPSDPSISLNPASFTWSVTPSDAGTFSAGSGPGTTIFTLKLCAKVDPKPKVTVNSGSLTASTEITPTANTAQWKEWHYNPFNCPTPCNNSSSKLGPGDACGNQITAKCSCSSVNGGTLFFLFNTFEFGKCCYSPGAYHKAWYKVQTNAASQERIVAVFHLNSNTPIIGYSRNLVAKASGKRREKKSF